MENRSDIESFLELKNDNEAAFERLFHKYYAPLCLFASHYLHDDQLAEEIVQDVFVKIWANRKQIDIGTSVKNYLFHFVRNRCLNQLAHQKVKKQHDHKIRSETGTEDSPETYFLEVGLQAKIEESIASLPEKRREIFLLSREKGLSYQQIAEHLNISVKTVETQMGLALKQLRQMLKDYKDAF